MCQEIYRQKQQKRAEIQAKQENKRLPAIARFFVIIYKIAKHQGDIEASKVLFSYPKYGERRFEP
ncbi:MAG: hypothetical protein [Bacteriophage sp.]|nr:MAG: hypothetical protein [Bacteriophage sp.]